MRLSPIIQKLGHPVVAVDGQDRIVAWNRAAELTFRIPASQALGRPAQELLHAHDIFGNPTCNHGCFLHEMARRGEAANCCEWDLHALKPGSRRFRVTFETMRDSPSAYILIYHLHPDRRNKLLRRRTDDLSIVPAQSESGRESAGPMRLASLTRREAEVLRFIGRGATTAAIASELGISLVTVRNHIEHLLRKLGVHSRLEAAALAHRAHLL